MPTHNNSRQSLNGHSSNNGRNHINGQQTSNHNNGHQTSNHINGHQTSNGLNGVPGNRNENEPPKPQTMDIMVQFFNDSRIKTFTVPVTATVDDLLKAIKEEKCIDMPIEQMRLVYAGKNLERGVKLSRYDIKGTVLLTGRLRGG